MRTATRFTTVCVIASLVLAAISVVALGRGRPQQASRRAPITVATASVSNGYPYATVPFLRLVRDSYGRVYGREPGEFMKWMARGYRRSGLAFFAQKMGLKKSLRTLRQDVARTPSGAARAQAEMRIAARLHALIKHLIPRFSLDRGYEFHNVVQNGERQCLLQSVLIASMLQRIGINAGVVMVFRNERGELSNNGHAVVLVKLSDGQDVLVDASYPEPSPQLQGLLVRAPHYQYVSPVYFGSSSRIVRYQRVGSAGALSPSQVEALDYEFVRSQFWYYRGERAAGGVLAAHPTSAGLTASARSLRESVSLCPKNALALYMLGRTYLAQGKVAEAGTLLSRANAEYARCGWVPDGPVEYLAAARARVQARG